MNKEHQKFADLQRQALIDLGLSEEEIKRGISPLLSFYMEIEEEIKMNKKVKFEATLKLKGVLTEDFVKRFEHDGIILNHLCRNIVNEAFQSTLKEIDIKIDDYSEVNPE